MGVRIKSGLFSVYFRFAMFLKVGRTPFTFNIFTFLFLALEKPDVANP